MLLSKTTVIKWNAKIKNIYVSKNYIFTKMGDEFEVKIEDLLECSNAHVNVKCDNPNCKDPYLKPMKWQTYKRYVHSNDKYYCNKCKTSKSIEETKRTKLKKSKSFEKWCIENNRQDVLDRWDYELNGCKPSEVSYGSNKKYYFKCSKELHKSELKSINDFTNKNSDDILTCNQCNSFAQWGINNLGEDFLEKYWDFENNTVDPWYVDKCSNKKVWINCQEKVYHNSSKIRCADFVNKSSRCAYCNSNSGKVHILDSLGIIHPRTLKIWSNKNKKSPYDYSPFSTQEVWWKCECGKHDDYKRKINVSNSNKFHCAKCSGEMNVSYLQEKIGMYIDNLGYKVLREYDCEIRCMNPKTNRLLPYDNEVYINNKKLIIEVHGRQHYHQSSGLWFDEEYDLHKRKLYDRYKRMYAKSKGYNYLEIPYWTDDREETWKKLINDKINEIIKS